MAEPNYRDIATQIGELIKSDTSINIINRTASAIFKFQKEHFPNEHITSIRAQAVYDWILSLGRKRMGNEERDRFLTEFCQRIVNEEQLRTVRKILKEGGVLTTATNAADLADFHDRNFHQKIHTHCRELYLNGHYFHAIFEACKVYNKEVRTKARSKSDGYSLMLEVWGPNGVLKITQCESETDKNIQNGIKFLSAGIMQAMRNPTAHEPAEEWPIIKEDCLNILSFMSFLFKKLDEAVYYKDDA